MLTQYYNGNVLAIAQVCSLHAERGVRERESDIISAIVACMHTGIFESQHPGPWSWR